ncbi:MAG: glycosyltransferase family 4 protein [Elusimicrobia bacterium]|nr:glycosyltransferase family 4 protein [Elusimicrobiota bacterium]
MHVAFLTAEYPPLPHGGIGTSVRSLARGLVRRGHRVTVLSWGEKSAFADEGVAVRVLAQAALPKTGWFMNRWRARAELNRMVREEGLNLAEAHDWCGISAGIRLECPLLVRCHGTSAYFADLLGEPSRAGLRWAESWALKGADALAAVSRFTAEATARLFGLARPIEVIHNGVDAAQFRPDSAGCEPGLLLYLGTIVRKKGVLDLCRIFSRVVELRPEARLVLAGRDAADRRTGAGSTWALCQAALSPPARERISYLGPQPYENVRALLNRASLCLFPSRAEALPMAWLEAMACGKAVVASSLGWGSEVIEHGASGLLADPADHEEYARAVAGLLKEPGRARRLGQAARLRVEAAFSIEGMVEKSLRWYEAALAGGKGGSP